MERPTPKTVREAVNRVAAHGYLYRYWPNVWYAPDEDEWPEEDEPMNHFRLADEDEAQWVELTWFTGPGSLASANRDALDEMVEDQDPERPYVLQPEDTTRLIWLEVTNPQVIQAILSLATYPLLDEEAAGVHELDQQDAAWSNWASHEFQRGVEQRLEDLAAPMGLEIIDLDTSDDDLYDLFRDMADEANVYWIEESDGSQTIAIDTILDRSLFPLRTALLRMLTPEERYHVLLGAIAEWLERQLRVELDFSRDDTVDPAEELTRLLRDWNPAGPGGWDLRSPPPRGDGFRNYRPKSSTPDMRFAPGSIGQFVPVSALGPYVTSAPEPPEMRPFPVERGTYPALRQRIEEATITRVAPPGPRKRPLEEVFPFAEAEFLPVRDIERETTGNPGRKKWDGDPPPEAQELPEEIDAIVRGFRERQARAAWRTPEGAHNVCFAASRAFVEYAAAHGPVATLIQIVWPRLDEEDTVDPYDPDTFGVQHYVAVVDGWPIDWTATQFCLPELGEDLGFPYVPVSLDDWVAWLDRVYHRSKYAEPQMYEEEPRESVGRGTTGSGAQLSVPVPLTYEAALDALGNRFRVTIGHNTQLFRPDPDSDDWWFGEDEIQVWLHGEPIIVLLPSGNGLIRVTRPSRLTMDRLKRITGLPVYRRKGTDYVETGGQRLELPVGEWVQVDLPLPPRPARTMEEALMPHTPSEDPDWPAPVDIFAARRLMERLPDRQQMLAAFTAGHMVVDSPREAAAVAELEQAFLEGDTQAVEEIYNRNRNRGPILEALAWAALERPISNPWVAVRAASTAGERIVRDRDSRLSPRAARTVWLREWWDRVRSRLAFREGGAADVTGAPRRERR